MAPPLRCGIFTSVGASSQQQSALLRNTFDDELDRCLLFAKNVNESRRLVVSCGRTLHAGSVLVLECETRSSKTPLATNASVVPRSKSYKRSRITVSTLHLRIKRRLKSASCTSLDSRSRHFDACQFSYSGRMAAGWSVLFSASDRAFESGRDRTASQFLRGNAAFFGLSGGL